jgi:hypothetical protein
MIENRIGDKTALFYVAHAIILEKNYKNYEKAKEIYEQGVKK